VHVALVNMPFAVADRPSIQCGTLAGTLRAAGHDVDVHYLNLQLSARLGQSTYHQLAAPRRQALLLGEWLFSVAAFGPDGAADLYRKACPEVDDACRDLGWSWERLCHLRDQELPALIDEWARQVPWGDYAVVGFSSTFEQNVASLALARAIKQRHPNVVVVFGGSNFDDEMGPEFVRAFDWIDHAVVGEGEIALCELVEQVAQGRSPAGVLGVVSRDDAASMEGCHAPVVAEMDALPDPDYQDYFATLFELGQEQVVGGQLPMVLFEGARGCWWGQRHHCTFCGLNSQTIAFRAKSPERVMAEIHRLANRYFVLSFEAVDNIMDMRYLSTVWRPLADAPYDYSFFFEVKANLSRDQLRTMAAAGVRAIQPGIESLSTPILKLMRKGTTLLHNVRVLKWSHHYGMRVGWNLLMGFPGEQLEDYEAQQRLIPLLFHLPPPAGAGPIWLERFSPYFTDGDFPIREKRPVPAYGFAYPDDQLDLDKIAYFFDYEADGVAPREVHVALQELVARWKGLWESGPAPLLAYQRGPDWIQIVDRRDTRSPRAFALHDDEALVYEICGDKERTAAQVVEGLGAVEARATTPRVEKILDKCCELGIMITEDGRYLSLALPVRAS
jgi:ribosomal peptide maturation radical SAM protein 1